MLVNKLSASNETINFPSMDKPLISRTKVNVSEATYLEGMLEKITQKFGEVVIVCPNGRDNRTKRRCRVGCPRFVHLG